MILETILGGVTGLVGNIVSGIFNYKSQQVQLERDKFNASHELDMVKAKTQAMIMKAKADIKVTQAQVEGAIELKDAEAYVESQKYGNQQQFSNEWVKGLMQVEGKWKIITFPVAVLVAFLFGLVDFLRGIMRPTLTAYLTLISSWITWKAWSIMQLHGQALTNDQAVTVFNETTSIIIYLTVSCVTWWFGDRRMAKTIMQLKGSDKSKMDDDINIK